MQLSSHYVIRHVPVSLWVFSWVYLSQEDPNHDGVGEQQQLHPNFTSVLHIACSFLVLDQFELQYIIYVLYRLIIFLDHFLNIL